MMIAGFIFLLFLTVGNAASSQSRYSDKQMSKQNTIAENEVKDDEMCSFHAVVNYLKLANDKNKYTLTRPVKNYTKITRVFHGMAIFAILDVRETDQTFISYIWVYMKWENEFIRWDAEQFCGIRRVIVPTEVLWMPDITIEEMTEKDQGTRSPYVRVNASGTVEFRNDQVVVSTCRMHVYKFPFDIQRCTLSFRSILHTDEELQLYYEENNTWITARSRRVMETQYEWLFMNMTVAKKLDHLNLNQTSIVYTITMRRRAVLYIANFILPVLFFMCLDLASFLISDCSGEKLSFQVTILLAVTVMQLILHEILPSSSDRVPLIAVYCIGVFTLMMLSLLETILVLYLIDKAAQDNEADGDRSLDENCWDKQGEASIHNCLREMKKIIHCASVCDASAEKTPPVTKEGSNSSKLTELSFTLEKVLDELREIEKRINLHSSKKKEEGKSGYWTRMVKKINTVFFIFYVTAITVFLGILFSLWNTSED